MCAEFELSDEWRLKAALPNGFSALMATDKQLARNMQWIHSDDHFEISNGGKKYVR